MPLQKFIFNPGINKEGTDYTAAGGWFDGNLVRFRKGFAEMACDWCGKYMRYGTDEELVEDLIQNKLLKRVE